jgi:hypothetical protein
MGGSDQWQDGWALLETYFLARPSDLYSFEISKTLPNFVTVSR